MKNLHFRLEYQTQWGENPEIVYSVDGADTQRLRLHTADGFVWETDITTDDHATHIRYAYQIVDNEGKALRIEPNSSRFFLFNHRSRVYFHDAWAEQTLPSVFRHTAFADCIMRPRGGDALHLEQLDNSALLLLHTLPPEGNLRWAVVGSTPEWGEWDVRKARVLKRTGTYEWALELSPKDFKEGVEYKYVLFDPTAPDGSQWETDGNRRISPCFPEAGYALVRQDEMPRIMLKPWRGAGCVIPVFSLRSKGSYGIGDFGDLRKLIRWASETELKAIQLLPINDTTQTKTWRDSYPYNSISVFALHPLYLDPRQWAGSEAYAHTKDEAAKLNAKPCLDYEAVYGLKMQFAMELFREIGANVRRTKAYKEFVGEQAEWLEPYAEFCVLRDTYHTANFRKWPEQFKVQSSKFKVQSSSDLLEPIKGWEAKLNFYRFVQFLLHEQMAQAHSEARELGIILKGDIPIGISPDSVPAWTDSRLFHFDGQAGAPPDAFARHGQNWGFPTYNWDEMAKDGYTWWRRRLAHMERYFDAYRIDHVLGFFRIWEIPSCHKYGLLGHFRPALPLSVDEIRGFGFTADILTFSRPYVSAGRLRALAQSLSLPTLEETYFEPCDNGGFTLKADYQAQREIERLVPEGNLRNALMDIVAEVLFIEDTEQQGVYQPRIAAQQTDVFQTLSDSDKDAFNRLHDHFFYSRHNDFWAAEAMKKLPAVTHCRDNRHAEVQLYNLESGGMLPCAEDLGMVPASVKSVLERLSILSLEIQRMPKEYGVQFGDLSHNPYLSVATIATHDMPPLRLWWKENAEQTQSFWTNALHRAGEAPEEATPEVCETVVSQHLSCPSMLCLLALQDLLAISPTLRSKQPEREQINVPANPNQYWQYRMHLTLEELIQATDFNEKLGALVVRTRN